LFFFVFFQAEDGIRDDLVTGVQTCALPILGAVAGRDRDRLAAPVRSVRARTAPASRAVAHLSRQFERGVLPGRPSGTRAPGVPKIGRASCRERAERAVVAVAVVLGCRVVSA